MSEGKTKAPYKKYYPTNVWDTIKSIGLASLNKGQFFLFILAFIIICFIWKMTANDVGILALTIVKDFREFYLIGWLLFILCIFAWYFSLKSYRRMHNQEIERISQEKKHLQELLISKKLNTTS